MVERYGGVASRFGETAAEMLYAHPNTVRYRMSRIGALTGLDLADGDDRLKVELALRILDVVGPRGAANA